MSQFPFAANDASAARAAQPIMLAGRRFDLALWEEPAQAAWHWSITAPGVLALSGEAASRTQAFDAARRAGLTLARLARRPAARVSAPAAPGSALP